MTAAAADREEPADAERVSDLDSMRHLLDALDDRPDADPEEPADVERVSDLDSMRHLLDWLDDRPDAADPEEPADAERVSDLDSMRHTALDLLDSLENQPERLRLQSGGVTVDLDWRRAASPTARPADGAVPAAGRTDGAVKAPGGADGVPAQREDPVAVEDAPVLQYVCSPSVGAFYQAPEPGGTPFAPVGAVLRAGQQVAIIEVMKLMLPVQTDHPGRVVEVLVKNGQTVEHGERLLALEPLDAD